MISMMCHIPFFSFLFFFSFTLANKITLYCTVQHYIFIYLVLEGQLVHVFCMRDELSQVNQVSVVISHSLHKRRATPESGFCCDVIFLKV